MSLGLPGIIAAHLIMAAIGLLIVLDAAAWRQRSKWIVVVVAAV